ncbi:hypothetical protein RE628_22985 [Paenibacillus sp. D2_2]|uniref:hypothetical protein n=1 Tax=Paenibacillus sp. D2_2 TaxID=3073092 RepID=UPI0028162971|nr:hypothetical protein [Paenibacillus sp. D2_2]WMT40126.1 hypothetical protein RE628_22985 [Paenibacillus sp. D2_2]
MNRCQWHRFFFVVVLQASLMLVLIRTEDQLVHILTRLFINIEYDKQSERRNENDGCEVKCKKAS